MKKNNVLRKMEHEELERLRKIRRAQMVNGRELNNPVPARPSIGLITNPSVADQVNAVLASGRVDKTQESLEDMMDFEIDDAFNTDEFISRYELMDDEEMISATELEEQEAEINPPVEEAPVEEQPTE